MPLTAVDHAGLTPLTVAVQARKPDMVKKLIAIGADPTKGDDSGAQPSHAAANQGLLDIVDVLLAHGADPNATTDYNRTPLHSSALPDFRRKGPRNEEQRQAQVTVIKQLIAAGADVSRKDEGGQTAADLAEENGESEVAASLKR